MPTLAYFPAETHVSGGFVWATIDYDLATTQSMEEIVDRARQSVGRIYRNIAEFGGGPKLMVIPKANHFDIGRELGISNSRFTKV